MSGSRRGLISIVLALYNGERFLKEQIESILSQTYRDWELIIADDGSADGGLETARAYAARDGRIRAYRNEARLGITANFLNGVRQASGEYVAFADQDDVWRADKLGSLKRLIEARPGTRLVYSDLEVCDENLRMIVPSFWRSARLHVRGGRVGEISVLRNIMPGCSMLFCAEVADALRRAKDDAPFMHDHLAFVLAAHTGRIDHTRERLVKYRQHSHNNIGAIRKSEAVFDRAAYAADLRRKTGYLERVYPELGIGWGKIGMFCDRLEGRSNGSNPANLIPYYLFLKENCLSGLCTALLEGFFPGAHTLKRAERSTLA